MKRTPIDGSFPWERWESDAADVEQLDRRQAARLLFDTLAINRFEHALLELKNAGAVWGPVHTSVGQEATASAAVAALRPTDKMAATYRAHHQFLAKVLQAQVPADWDPAAGELPEEAQEVFYRTMAEIMGLAPGYCGGRGGSMHLRHNESGFLGSNAIVGGGVPLAAGAAYAEKFAGSGNVIVCYIGDGAVNQGAFHEACNLAGLWSLPLIVFVENNRYAVATRVQDACAVEPLSRRASAYAMDGYVVDGDDAIAILGLVREVADKLRDGGTPAIIECECYRRYHHAGDVPGSAFRYRSKEEEDRYAGTEVTRVLPRILVEAGLLDQAAVETSTRWPSRACRRRGRRARKRAIRRACARACGPIPARPATACARADASLKACASSTANRTAGTGRTGTARTGTARRWSRCATRTRSPR